MYSTQIKAEKRAHKLARDKHRFFYVVYGGDGEYAVASEFETFTFFDGCPVVATADGSEIIRHRVNLTY